MTKHELAKHVLERPLSDAALDGRLPAGARSVSVFLVNRRPPDVQHPDAAYVFQHQQRLGAPARHLGCRELRA